MFDRTCATPVCPRCASSLMCKPEHRSGPGAGCASLGRAREKAAQLIAAAEECYGIN